MGKYQWHLFCLAGFGYTCDQVLAGLMLGSTFWGLGADLIGRKIAFNTTLLISSIFGLSAGGSPNFLAACCLLACCGFELGGNMPVDSIIFLEFLPSSHGYLLELFTVWWAVGQFIPAFALWGLISNFSSSADTPAGECQRADNMGWGYLLFTMGALTMVAWILRFFCFNLQESPKYLVAERRYSEAIKVLETVAAYNGTTQSLQVTDLEAVEHNSPIPNTTQRKATLARATELVNPAATIDHLRGLCATKEMTLSFFMVLLLWGMIGMANPIYNSFLPVYLAIHGAQSGDKRIPTTYRNLFITVICSIPGTVLGAWLINVRKIGRKGTLGVSLLLTGSFLFAFTTARTQGTILAFNCIISFTQFTIWGALYCYTPEVFPSIHRGTGTGLAAAFNRLCGLSGALITTYSGFTNVPPYIGAAMWLGADLLSFALTFATRNKASL
ncbi:MFS general substrate transporter [Tothia fuscella]|uniref:MFS general substrate transporter n=1 Tax=Tothia fuscella TaxID=1048955 RepID=A0A9P4NIS1_9PEZI|nr:MFS general substrate transporter [Tothia fuscella]